MAEAKGVIISGGTRGIGAGLVKAFAEAAWTVHFTGRTEASVGAALAALPRGVADRCFGYPCKADDAVRLAELWDAASKIGRVEAVICNAGMSVPVPSLPDTDLETLRTVVATNVLGPLVAAKVLIPRLEAQGGGFFYAMEGLGSDGRWVRSMSLYGTTKYALAYLLKALARESRGTNVSVGALSPGMVVTDLLLAGAGGLAGIPAMEPSRKRIYSILADRVETVAPWLASKVVADVGRGSRPGKYRRFAWLTGGKAFRRFLGSAFMKRRVFD